MPVVLVGTKTDLVDDRLVTFREAKDEADAHNIKYLECSSKTGEGVD